MWDSVYDIGVVTVGLASLAWSVVSGFSTAAFIKRTSETTGEVVRLQKSKGSFIYQRLDSVPVFRFRTEDGKSHTVTSKFGTFPSRFEVGDTVQVRYDTADPNNARIATLFQTWGQSVIAGVICIIAFGPIVLNRLGAFR
jgi:hypothetical protein